MKTRRTRTSGQDSVLKALASTLVSRVKFAQQLGQSYGTDRDLYRICGYPLSITFEQYEGRYERQDIASRIVNAYPDATWRNEPQVYETEEADETAWEKAWTGVTKDLRLYHYLNRTDRLAGIGQYAVLFLGFDDGKDFSQPVTGAKRLVYLQAYNQSNAAIAQKNEDTKDPRYGLPEYYSLIQHEDADNLIGGTPAPIDARVRGSAGMIGKNRVHWTRVLHIADGCLDSDVFGTPRLQSVYNRLQDLEMMAGGSAEMWWRAGFPGLQFVADPEAELPDKEEMKDQIEKYIHGLQRYLRLQGVEAKSIGSPGGLTAPTSYFDLEIALISSSSQIPKRILLGSERGELASDQDERAWHDRIDERRKTWAAPSVMMQLIRQMTMAGVLPELPEGEGPTVEWAPIEEQSATEKQTIAKMKTDTLVAYVGGGVDAIVPPKQFLMVVMGMTEEEADTMISEAVDYQTSPEKEALSPAPELPPEMGPDGKPVEEGEPGQKGKAPPFGKKPFPPKGQKQLAEKEEGQGKTGQEPQKDA